MAKPEQAATDADSTTGAGKINRAFTVTRPSRNLIHCLSASEMNYFPKRSKTAKTAEIGINVVSTVINDDFGWIFRRTHQENDFGIDAYIDYVGLDGAVTGKTLAVQIKTGRSYLSQSGSMHWYHDSVAHLNYFLNSSVPVLLIICDPDSRACHWSLLEKGSVDYQGDGKWRHPVPKINTLHGSREEIASLFGQHEDHVSEFEVDQRMLTLLADKSTFIQYSVPKEDVESLNTKQLNEFFVRITRSEKLAAAIQGRLYVSTYGYELDTREVFQIKEVCAWTQKALEDISSWYVCARNDNTIPSTLRWIASCTCSISSRPVRRRNGSWEHFIKFDPDRLQKLRNECFHALNEDSDKWGWNTPTNYRISKAIHKEFFPTVPFPPLK